MIRNYDEKNTCESEKSIIIQENDAFYPIST